MKKQLITKEEEHSILNELLDSYVVCHLLDDQKLKFFNNLYKDILDNIVIHNKDKVLSLYKEATLYKIENKIPYVIVSYEIDGLKNIILKKLYNDIDSDKILQLIDLFKDINNVVAKIYLEKYIKELEETNYDRLNSLSDIIHKDIIKHYEAHLKWLNDLTKHVEDFDKNNFPELNHTLCDFGKWLYSDAKSFIANKDRYEKLLSIHHILHLFASKIYTNLEKREYHTLISYLEKCEMISLKIGTELTLIDNIELNKHMVKDTLTQALNRNALEHIFHKQYELAFATSNKFVLAICDLDNFKKINDTYGHIAGDLVLKEFVLCVKNTIRNSDIVIRFGGEEFIIILPALTKKEGEKVLEKIRKNFEKLKIVFNGKVLRSTVSIGAFEVNPRKKYHKKYLNEYINICDDLLYEAKRLGKNKVEFL